MSNSKFLFAALVCAGGGSACSAFHGDAPATVAAASPTTAAGEPVHVHVHRRADVASRAPDVERPQVRVWTLEQTPTSRTNFVEIREPIAPHMHPDAAHSLYVLEGSLVVQARSEELTLTAGDFVSIPAGVPHGYRPTNAGQAVRLISMDSPAYDSKKTVAAP